VYAYVRRRPRTLVVPVAGSYVASISSGPLGTPSRSFASGRVSPSRPQSKLRTPLFAQPAGDTPRPPLATRAMAMPNCAFSTILFAPPKM
jgi:hypothetical protein